MRAMRRAFVHRVGAMELTRGAGLTGQNLLGNITITTEEGVQITVDLAPKREVPKIDPKLAEPMPVASGSHGEVQESNVRDTPLSPRPVRAAAAQANAANQRNASAEADADDEEGGRRPRGDGDFQVDVTTSSAAGDLATSGLAAGDILLGDVFISHPDGTQRKIKGQFSKEGDNGKGKGREECVGSLFAVEAALMQSADPHRSLRRARCWTASSSPTPICPTPRSARA